MDSAESMKRGEKKLTISEANFPFPQGIKAIISRKGLKDKYVAEKAGCTKQQLSHILNGRKLLKACDICSLASALEVTLDELYAAGIEAGTEAKG